MTIQEVKIKPNRIPFRCPVCNGFGSLKHGSLECHACKGKGFVVVDNKERQTDEDQTGTY